MKKLSVVFAINFILVSCSSVKATEQKIPTTLIATSEIAITSTNTIIPTLIPTATQVHNKTTHGYILKDETWSGEITIIGDIIVEKGTTLTIEPGTIVHISANQDIENLLDDPFDLQQGVNKGKPEGGVLTNEPFRDENHHISILINGTLNAIGTPENMITITSDSPTPDRYDWNSFKFNKGILSYATVEYYRTLSPGDAEISHNILRHIGECGVCINNNSDVVVVNNQIYDAGHELINMHKSSPTIRGNNIGPTKQEGQFAPYAGIIVDGGSPKIFDNKFDNCGIGILFISPPENPDIHDNTFTKVGQDILHEY